MFSKLEVAGSDSEFCQAVGFPVGTTKIPENTNKSFMHLFAYIYF
jgi:hypothetical protein